MAVLDCFRGAALVGMAVFHFVWDLEFFGIAAPGTADRLFWRIFAAAVAGSFLFISGASLYLAHARRIRWKPWARRLAVVALAAAAVSAVTYLATPERYIRFGILHMIAAAGAVGLVFLRAPWPLTAAAAAAVLAADRFLTVGWLEASWLFWLGFTPWVPSASDFRPLFPWLAPALLGAAAAKMCRQADWLRILAELRMDGGPWPPVRFLGRHSLLFYLLHQPLLFALIWTWLRIAG